MSAVLKIQDATASVSLRGGGGVEWSGVRIRALSQALARCAIERGAKVRMGGARFMRCVRIQGAMRARGEEGRTEP